MLQRLLLAAIAALAGLAMTSVPLQAQTLDKIKQRGVLVVGTKGVVEHAASERRARVQTSAQNLP